MKYLLSGFLIYLIGTQTFGISDSIGLGLSVKNLVMYGLTAGLMLRLVVSGRFKADLMVLQGCFLLLVVYATLTYLIEVFVVSNPGYGVLEAGVWLKSGMYDYFIFFLLFFYGLENLEDTLSVTDTFLAGMVFANVVTVLDASGLVPLGIIRTSNDYLDELGRVQGAFGEANQHAALVAMTLPAVFARALLAHGVSRLAWAAGVLFMVGALLATASRGGVAGLVIGLLWGFFLFRRFLPLGKIAAWSGIAVVLLTLIIVAFSATYTDLLVQRFITQSTSGDVETLSSGRSYVWAQALARMIEQPWTFLSGYGWHAYSFMGFEYVTHNQYLYYLFNLGIVGLLAWLGIIVAAVFTARNAAETSTERVRPYFIGFVVGYLSVCGAVFFVDLDTPWYYVFAYLGMTMRAAVCVSRAREKERRERAARDGLRVARSSTRAAGRARSGHPVGAAGQGGGVSGR